MSTYSYKLCRHCGGSGKGENASECSQCQGAGLTSRLIDEDALTVKLKIDPSLTQARTIDFSFPRHME